MAEEDRLEAEMEYVSIDGLVLLNLVKHAEDCEGEGGTGLLLGMDQKNSLEVTHSFPFPSAPTGQFEDEESEMMAVGADYQYEMLRCLREVNVDAFTVGWYQTAELSSYMNEALIETQYGYQTDPLLSRKSCVVIYDPLRSKQEGKLCVEALRLTPDFVKVYASDRNCVKSYIERKTNIFEKVPIRIVNNSLVEAFFLTLKSDSKLEPSFRKLDLGNNAYFEKNLEIMGSYLEGLQNDNFRLQYHQRSVSRQQSQIHGYQHKIRMENQARKERGQDEIKEDLSQFKKLSPPARLQNLLWMNQVDDFVTKVNSFANESAARLFLLEAVALQK